jgi:hypothetical protein
MFRIALVGLSLVTLIGGWTFVGGSAQGQLVFKSLWDKKYFTEDSEMKKAYTTSTCNFCHIGGTMDRKNRNKHLRPGARQAAQRRRRQELHLQGQDREPGTLSEDRRKNPQGLRDGREGTLGPQGQELPHVRRTDQAGQAAQVAR